MGEEEVKTVEAEGKEKKKRKKRPAALSEERTPKLTKVQLLKWRMLEAEARAAKAELETARVTLTFLVSKYPEIVSAQKSADAFRKEYGERKRAYNEYMTSLGESLGLDIRNVAIDEETGLVRELP